MTLIVTIHDTIVIERVGDFYWKVSTQLFAQSTRIFTSQSSNQLHYDSQAELLKAMLNIPSCWNDRLAYLRWCTIKLVSSDWKTVPRLFTAFLWQPPPNYCSSNLRLIPSHNLWCPEAKDAPMMVRFVVGSAVMFDCAFPSHDQPTNWLSLDEAHRIIWEMAAWEFSISILTLAHTVASATAVDLPMLVSLEIVALWVNSAPPPPWRSLRIELNCWMEPLILHRQQRRISDGQLNNW